jgi:hypothetical protein
MKKTKKTATLRQEKLIGLLRENMGILNHTKKKGELLLEAGYTKATAKNAYEIFNSPAVREAADDIAKSLNDKRKMALANITEEKLRVSTALNLAYITDILTKNIQLLNGGATENRFVINISKEIAEKNNLLGMRQESISIQTKDGSSL